MKDAFRYMPSHVIPGVLGIVSLSVFTRLLKPEDYAQYTLILTTIAFAANIGFAWLNFSGLRFYDESRSHMETFMSTCILSLAAIFAVMTALGYVLLRNVYRLGFTCVTTQIFWTGLVLLLLKVTFDQMLILLTAERKALRHSIYRSLDALVKLSLAVFLIRIGNLNYLAIIYAMAISYVILILYELLHSPKYSAISLRHFSKPRFIEMYRYGFPLMGVGLTNTALSLADRYLLAWLGDNTQVGMYSAVYRLAEMAIDIPSAILLMAYTPIVIQAFNASREELGSILHQPLQLIFIVLLPFCCGATFLARDFTTLMLGPGYRNAYCLFPYVCSATFCMALNHLYTRIFELEKATRFVLYASGIAAIANVLINILLIPRYGILGAGIATCAAYLIQFAATFLFTLPLIRIPMPYKTLASTLLACIVMLAGLATLNRIFPQVGWGMVFLKIGVGAILYLIMMYVTREPLTISFLRKGLA